MKRGYHREDSNKDQTIENDLACLIEECSGKPFNSFNKKKEEEKGEREITNKRKRERKKRGKEEQRKGRN